MNLNNDAPDTDAEEEEEEQQPKPKSKKQKKRKAAVIVETFEEEPEKKQKTVVPVRPQPPVPTGKYRFFLQLDQVTGFRLLVTILMNMVEDMTFKIIRTNSFQGIQFNVWLNKGSACFASGSQSMTIQELIGDSLEFSVNLGEFGNSLKAIAHTAVTQIYQAINDDYIVIEALDSMTKKVTRYRLPTLALDEDVDKGKLDTTVFDFQLEFPLSDLDRVCKAAHTFNSKNISISLLKKSDQDIYIRLWTQGGRVELSEYFRATVGASGAIRASNAASISSFDEADSVTITQPIKSDFSEYKVLADGAFNIENIAKFIKPLEKNFVIIFIRLDKERIPDCHCICFQHMFSNNLVSEYDRIRYVVGAQEQIANTIGS